MTTVFEQYTEGDFFTIEYFEDLIPGLPPPAYEIIWKHANERMKRATEDLIKDLHELDMDTQSKASSE